MKNKLISLLMTMTILMVLTACQAKPDSPAASAPSEDDTAFTPSDAAPMESASGEPSGTSSGEPAEAENSRLEEYRSALRKIAFEHVYPDGTDTGFDSAYGSIEDNRFAVYDVNGDGVDELIVRFTTAPMAGNIETIYAFQKADGAMKQILIASPNLTYYANGIIKEDWAHGSGLAGEEYWPYTLYQYNAAEGSFEELAQVNMWSKAVETVDYKGDPYPDDIDKEGAGTVFILGDSDEVKTVSKSDYEQWLDQTMDSAAEMDIPYQALSKENIEALK